MRRSTIEVPPAIHAGSPADQTSSSKSAVPGFEALGPVGFPVIPDFSHLRRSRSDVPGERIFRRGYNYDEAPAGASVSDAGLLFASFQADVDRQFVPVQRRLDEVDLLNEWTTPIGSAVFAVPPGCAEGEFLGQALLGCGPTGDGPYGVLRRSGRAVPLRWVAPDVRM